MTKSTAAGTPAEKIPVETDAAPPAAIVEEQPAQGGSYVRDPATGKLTRVAGPKEA